MPVWWERTYQDVGVHRFSGSPLSEKAWNSMNEFFERKTIKLEYQLSPCRLHWRGTWCKGSMKAGPEQFREKWPRKAGRKGDGVGKREGSVGVGQWAAPAAVWCLRVIQDRASCCSGRCSGTPWMVVRDARENGNSGLGYELYLWHYSGPCGAWLYVCSND